MVDIFSVEYWEQYDICDYDRLKEYLCYINDIVCCGERDLDYSEWHHIVPRSFDKSISDSDFNYVRLSGKEHFIAHKLLVGCFEGKYNSKAAYALHRMCFGNGNNGRDEVSPEDYEFKRRELSKVVAMNNKSEKIRKAVSESKKGIKRSEECIRKISENHADTSGENNPCYGKKLYNNGEIQRYIKPDEIDYYVSIGFVKGSLEEYKKAASERMKGEKNHQYGKRGELSPNYGKHGEGVTMYGKHHTKESKEKISNSLKGKNNYTDGNKNTKIRDGEVIPDGFYRGQTQNR